MNGIRTLGLIGADLGRRAGVRGTPTFFVDGVIVDVSFGLEHLERAIAARLRD